MQEKLVEIRFAAQELILENPKIWCPLERRGGNYRSNGKYVLPTLFSDMVSARAGKLTLGRGAM